MNQPATAKVAGLRLLLFLVLPIAIVAGLELLVPLSMLLSSVVFLPFLAHGLDLSSTTGPRVTVFAEAPWAYILNGAFILLAAFVTVSVGRRYSFSANVALYFGVTIVLAALTHVGLLAAGFPFGADSP